MSMPIICCKVRFGASHTYLGTARAAKRFWFPPGHGAFSLWRFVLQSAVRYSSSFVLDNPKSSTQSEILYGIDVHSFQDLVIVDIFHTFAYIFHVRIQILSPCCRWILSLWLKWWPLHNWKHCVGQRISLPFMMRMHNVWCRVCLVCNILFVL